MWIYSTLVGCTVCHNLGFSCNFLLTLRDVLVTLWQYKMSTGSGSLWRSWSLGFLERCIPNIDYGRWETTLPLLESPEERTDISCSWSQVSNPSIQFMLYETMLKKLRKRRALSKQGNNGITALEVWFSFNTNALLLTYFYCQFLVS